MVQYERRRIAMNYGKKLFTILACAFGMVVAITGICFITEYFQVSNPNTGYILLVLGGFVTIFYLKKLKDL